MQQLWFLFTGFDAASGRAATSSGHGDFLVTYLFQTASELGLGAPRGLHMSNPADHDVPDDWTRTANERPFIRIGQIMNRVAQGVEAQKSAARFTERNTRYMLWAAALAATSTVITAAAVVFCVVVYLTRLSH
jgi:hypothetical protein